MPFTVSIEEAKAAYPEYDFLAELTPSEQKAAFHVRDKDGNHLCLKLIAPSYDIDRLGRETQALRQLNHPNVARLKEYMFVSTDKEQRHHLIEEFVEGKDLSASLKGKPWQRPKVASLFAALCDGLDELRKINVVHRDLKPSNIRVRPNDSPVIIDFGVARHLALPDLTNTEDGARIGSPLYFAPEQFRGNKHDIEHRTDLFAVGLLMYEALIGRHPFFTGKETLGAVEKAVCNSVEPLQAKEFATLPPEWATLVGKLLEKERGRRPQSAAQVATILRKIADK